MVAKIVDQMTWWLRKGRPFTVDDQFLIELIEIDPKTNTAKIIIKKIKDKANDDAR